MVPKRRGVLSVPMLRKSTRIQSKQPIEEQDLTVKEGGKEIPLFFLRASRSGGGGLEPQESGLGTRNFGRARQIARAKERYLSAKQWKEWSNLEISMEGNPVQPRDKKRRKVLLVA